MPWHQKSARRRKNSQAELASLAAAGTLATRTGIERALSGLRALSMRARWRRLSTPRAGGRASIGGDSSQLTRRSPCAAQSCRGLRRRRCRAGGGPRRSRQRASALGVIDLADVSDGSERASQILLWRTLVLSAPGRATTPNESRFPAGSSFVSDPKRCGALGARAQVLKDAPGVCAESHARRTRQLLYPFLRL